MQSSGGITALKSAAREPVRTVLSGPAGGLVGAAAMAARSGFGKILSFDMGGTSTDVAAVQGEVHAGGQSEVAGLPVGVPMLEIHTVGAGGGSLARFDAGGLLRVGPESAGADPGPICYGRGTQPTVTDANLLLGRLRPDRFLGGEFTLDVERTRRVTSQWLKNQGSRLSLEQFSERRGASGEREHGAGLARRFHRARIRSARVRAGRLRRRGRFACLRTGPGALAIPTVIIPARPGALSAFGILVSDVVKDFSRTLLWRFSSRPRAVELEKEFRKLETAARKQFAEELWRGSPHYERSLDLRYRGQGYEINVPSAGDVAARFHDEHQRRYGYHHAGREIELVTLRLRARIRMEKLRIKQGMGNAGRPSKALPVERAKAIFQGKSIVTAIYERGDLVPGESSRGPAVITEYSATTVIPPGKRFQIDDAENLLISIQ